MGTWKLSHITYRYLRRQWIYVPCESTLERLQRKCALKPGHNPVLLSSLKNLVKRELTAERDRFLAIVIDEMNVDPHMDYDKVKGVITGTEDWGLRVVDNVDREAFNLAEDVKVMKTTTTYQYADHVFLGLIRSLTTGKRVILEHGFCKSQTKYLNLAEILERMVQCLEECGFIVQILICDQATTNRALVNHFI